MYDVAAAKVPVRLSNGNVVIVTPFTNRDLLTIFKMVQKKYLSKMVEAIPHDLPPEQYRAAYAEALAESKGFSIEQIGQLIGELADIDVVHTMLLMAIQNADKVVDAIIDVREDFDAVMQAINTSSGSDKDDDERANEKEENDENPPKTSQL